MGWIKTDIHPDVPAACLTVSRKHSIVEKLEYHLEAFERSPIESEEGIHNLIERFRPELRGGILVSVRYDSPTNAWQINYAHRSLPRKGEYEEPYTTPLIPETWRDKEAML